MSAAPGVSQVDGKGAIAHDHDVDQGDTIESTTSRSEKPKPEHKQQEKQEQKQEPTHDAASKRKGDGEQDKGNNPPGGFDATPIPRSERGYTVKFTFHRATNLPIADLRALSSDPFILAQLTTNVPTRHKEDPPLRFRTATIGKCTDPEWNQSWIVANVPASGFRLKLRVYDEDPNDADDRLGNAYINVDSLHSDWKGFKEKECKVHPRSGSKRAYAIRGIAKCFGAKKQMHGTLIASVEVLGRTEEDGQNGRLYTVGPCRWFKHYSPMLGRLANIKEPNDSDSEPQRQASRAASSGSQQDPSKKKVQQYNFQANQMQLQGPVPAQLYHRYVEFKPFVRRMFTASGIGGTILSKALHHQHARVYNFGRTTEYGQFPDGPSREMTRKFLDMVHHDEGGRIFTYVLTLDALFRFTETGKEFGIDMLSKHTMHSDVSIYIAFSGEFFIRRLKHARRPPPPEPVEKTTYGQQHSHEDNPTHPPAGEMEVEQQDARDPSQYELIIDNDSGTYRPNAKLLPQLQDFMSRSFPGLHIQVLDCQKDEEKMNKMKDEQRERKKKEGDHLLVVQGDRSSSLSSSDIEDFDRLQATLVNSNARGPHEHGVIGQATKTVKRKQQARWEKVKGDAKGRGDTDDQAEAAADDAEPDARR